MWSRMTGRMACVSLSRFSLQILRGDREEVLGIPVAVLSADTARGRICEVNEEAFSAGIRVGDFHAAALARCPSLRAEMVSSQQIKQCEDSILKVLTRFSPCVEASEVPGVFWMDCRGLGALFSSIGAFVREVRCAVSQNGFIADICVGYSRFGTFAIARSGLSLEIVSDAEVEREVVGRIPLSALGVAPSELKSLHRLGVYTVADLLRIPREGLQSRFSAPLLRLYSEAEGSVVIPLRPKSELVNPQLSVSLPWPESHLERLLFVVKSALRQLFEELAQRHCVLSRLTITLHVEKCPDLVLTISPADPGLEMVKLIELVRLRFLSIVLSGKVTDVDFEAYPVEAVSEQLALFFASGRRDLQAAREGISRLQAEFGECVEMAILVDGHLPEGKWRLQAMGRLRAARPTQGKQVLQRRIQRRPIPLYASPLESPAGVHFFGMEPAPIVEMTGPFRVNGGWWNTEVSREYYFALTEKNCVLWIYWDQRRRFWFLQGRIE